MVVKTVAIISPGDMGHSVGSVLRDNGFDVITCLVHDYNACINIYYYTLIPLGNTDV